jgi:acyl carrier protein
MENSELLFKIKEILARVTGLDVEDIGDSDSFEEDLELDSLSMLEVWVEIDRTFHSDQVKIPNEEIVEIKTLNEAVARIQQELAKS